LASPASQSAVHTAPVIDLRGVRFAWTAGTQDVVAIDALRIEVGERVLLHGASGSGKSTLLALLAGVAVARAGQVRVLGTDLAVLGPAARDRFRADHTGLVFQMFNLVPYLSVVDNVLLPCGFSSRRRARAAARGGSARAEALRLLASLGMDSPRLLARQPAQLSVGQQQRVAAARALIGAPELVIADEPTSALDADRRDTFLDLLFRECAREATTLLLVSHDVALAPRFDRRIAFEDINATAIEDASA
jgi:putative ABC transport system ATP-binding protein